MKYYATFGPACCSPDILEKIVSMGTDGFRLNLSHGKLEDRLDWINNLRSVCEKMQKNVEIVLDINGSESRIVTSKILKIKKGDFIQFSPEESSEIKIDYEVFSIVEESDILSVDDGRFLFEVIEKRNNHLIAKSMGEGVLLNLKSISVRGKEIDLPLLSPIDIENLKIAKKLNIQSVMQPFVKSKSDVEFLRDEMKRLGFDNPYIYAKIEEINGVKNVREISKVSDVVVIARGDLGNNMGILLVPKIQKELSKILFEEKSEFMVVTEMLTSMLDSQIPIRGELNDIYNSVLDGCTHLMLTKETAIGKYPDKAMEFLIKEAEIGYEKFI